MRANVAEWVRELVRETCGVFEIRNVKGFMSQDHMHILLNSPTDMAPTDILRLVKGRASSKMFESFAHIRQSTEATFLGEGGLLLCDVRIDNRGDDQEVFGASL